MKRIFLLLALLCWMPDALLALTFVWEGDVNTSWQVGGNWDQGTVPGPADLAHFDGVLDNNCDMDGGIGVLGIQVDAGYTGTIDFTAGAPTEHEVGSSGIVLDGGTINMGDSAFIVTGGPFDYRDVAGWTTGTGSVTLVGDCTVTGDYAQDLYDLTLSPGDGCATTISSSTDSRVEAINTCTISGAVVLDDVLAVSGDGDMVLNEGASFTGSSVLYCMSSKSGHGLTTLHSSVTTGNVQIYGSVAGTRLASGTYGGLVRVFALTAQSTLLELDNGTYNFNGGLKLQNAGTGLVTLQNKTNDPTINVTDLTIDLDSTGNVLIDDDATAVTWNVSGNIVDQDSGGGSFSWTQGTGTKTLTGTADQTIGTAGGGGLSIGEWDIQKTTSGKVAIDNVTMQLGDIDMVGDGSEALVVGANAGCTITSTADAKNFVGATANSADVNFSAAGNDIDLGTATWTVTNGDWVTASAGTWDYGTSTVAFLGTGTINTGVTNSFYNLTSTSGTSTVSTNDTLVANTLTINGTLSVDVYKTLYAGGTLTLGDGAELTGSGRCRIHNPGSAEGVTSFHSGATWDIASTWISQPNTAAVLAPGNYQSVVKVLNASNTTDYALTLTADGEYEFDSLELETTGTNALTLNNTGGPASVTVNGDLTFDKDSTGGVSVTNSGKAVSWVIAGDVKDEGAANWVQGTGTITASGTAAQDWDWGSVTGTLEDIVVNKSAGTLTFGGGWTADSFTFTDGSLDVGGQTIATTGDFSVAPGCTFGTGGAGLDGADITVGGNFAVTGSAATDVDMTASAWALDLTGGGHCQWVNVTNCDASATSPVYARRSVDGGSNTNWIFSVRPRASYSRHSARGLFKGCRTRRGVGAN